MSIFHIDQLKKGDRVEGAIDRPKSLKIAGTGYCLAVLSWLFTLGPAIFFFLVVQHSAIIFPFWDHCEFIKYFAKLHDHELRLRDLWAPHNHARPLVLRLLIIGNGLLTDWDIGSEYIYLQASVIAAFALQVACLRRLCGRWSLQCLFLVSILSIFSFSPAGHNNHWWSFMLSLDLAHFFIVIAFIVACFAPRSWRSNIVAAVFCWLATYTLTNGLVAFVAAAITIHIAQRPWIRFDRITLFWSVNILTALFLYLPGLNETATGLPNFVKLCEFLLAFLGSPIASLFVFPYRNMFDVPQVTFRNEVFGVVVCFAAIALLWLLQRRLALFRSSALLFICFSSFAIGSGLLTGIGRSDFDALGIANANASRYTIFSTYLAYAILYGLSDLTITDLPARLQEKQRLEVLKNALVFLAIGFFAVVTLTYATSVRIYQEAHNFNQTLAEAFWGDPKNLKYVYPNSRVIADMVDDLKRLRIGPYRFGHFDERDLIQTLSSHKTLDQFGVNGLRDLPALGQVLFANPSSRFEMRVPATNTEIRFMFGISDGATKAVPTMQGVNFQLFLRRRSGEEQLLWSRSLQPVTVAADNGLQSARVMIKLQEEYTLIFATAAIGDAQGCWAFWKDVEAR